MTATPTAPVAAAPIITLTHRQEVRVKEFEGKYASKISVFTTAGYYRENGKNTTEAEILSQIAESEARHGKLNPCALQDCSVLSADYPGKTEELDAAAAATAAAPEIKNGDVVSIDGVLYTTWVGSVRTSDPVYFASIG